MAYHAGAALSAVPPLLQRATKSPDAPDTERVLMPTIPTILEPKLTAVETKIAGIKTKLREGVYPEMTGELRVLADEVAFISEFAKRLLVETRMFSP